MADSSTTPNGLALHGGGRLKIHSTGILVLEEGSGVAHVKAPAARTVSAGFGTSSLAWSGPLDPQEVKYFTVDWADEMGGTNDSIATSTFVLSATAVAAGLVIHSQSNDSTSATVWLKVALAHQTDSVFQSGQSHTITNTITTTGGQTMERNAAVTVRQL